MRCVKFVERLDETLQREGCKVVYRYIRASSDFDGDFALEFKLEFGTEEKF